MLIDAMPGGDARLLARIASLPYADVFALDATTIDDVVVSRELTLVTAAASCATCVARSTGSRPVARCLGTATRCSSTTGCTLARGRSMPRFADHSLDAAGHGAGDQCPGTITAVLVAPGDA